MQFISTLIAAFAATTALAAPLGPILPPSNPSANASPKYCRTWQDCLTAINAARSSQEGLPAIALPSNWWDLTYGQRVWAFINLERVSRNLQPLATMVNTYDSQVETAVTNDADPIAPYGVGSWGSIWAGGQGMFPLSAIYLWMYVDGPGGNNLDCTTSKTDGCWGHRDIILGADFNAIDSCAGKDSMGQDSFAALLLSPETAPAAANTVMTWDAQKAFSAQGTY
ncbi:hypothetical protein KVT40_003765 [Elsinoe batatas]|uniref:Uncharacterized protein n=1 Tax=Elsinoe batatas TaxID=2601811 RepID=A0A8K0L2G9_9PEZI|nr:hypothetical protein KVT40_003765 [Elsinoe batatas]